MFRYIRVKIVGAKFRCHIKGCGKMWRSNHAWVEFDMKKQEVRRM